MTTRPGSLYPAVCVGDVTSKAGMYVKSTNYVTNLASSSSFYFILVYFLLFLAGRGGGVSLVECEPT